MLRRRVATCCETTKEPDKSKKSRLPALKRQVEIDLEYQLHVTRVHDESIYLGGIHEVNAGRSGRLAIEPKKRRT